MNRRHSFHMHTFRSRPKRLGKIKCLSTSEFFFNFFQVLSMWCCRAESLRAYRKLVKSPEIKERSLLKRGDCFLEEDELKDSLVSEFLSCSLQIQAKWKICLLHLRKRYWWINEFSAVSLIFLRWGESDLFDSILWRSSQGAEQMWWFFCGLQ